MTYLRKKTKTNLVSKMERSQGAKIYQKIKVPLESCGAYWNLTKSDICYTPKTHCINLKTLPLLNTKTTICMKLPILSSQAVYFDKRKRSLKSQSTEIYLELWHQKNKIAEHYWEDFSFYWDWKKVIDTESWFSSKKVEKSIHSLRNPNHINTISSILPEMNFKLH